MRAPPLKLLSRFMREWVRCAIWGAHLWQRCVKLAVLAATSVYAISDSTPVAIALGDHGRWTTTVGVAVAIELGIVWIAGAFAAAWLRFWKSIIAIGDFEADLEHGFYRLAIENVGYGQTEAEVALERVLNDAGRDVVTPSVAANEIEWTHLPPGARPRLIKGRPRWVGLLGISDLAGANPHLVVFGMYHHQQIDREVPWTARQRLWLKVSARDVGGWHATEKWFSVRPDRGLPLLYRVEAGEPPFLVVRRLKAAVKRAFLSTKSSRLWHKTWELCQKALNAVRSLCRR